MSELDCLLIVPNSRASAYGSLAQFAAIEPPVWAGLLATFLRTQGVGVEILDAHALDLSADAIGQTVSDAAPHLACLVASGHQPSASTQTMPAARQALRAIREADRRIATAILGGHVSALPARTLREEPVDFVIQGEGPATVAALIPAVKHRRDLVGVPGLWWRRTSGGPLLRNAPAPPLRDLDMALPTSAWDLLPPLTHYRAHNWHALGYASASPYAAIYTTLNCPYACSFCMISAPFGGPGYLRWSPERIGSQVAGLVEHGVRHLKIVDEMFWLNERHVEAIADQFIERGLGDQLNIWAYARVDTVRNPALLDKARRAGIRWLALGIEAADSHVRDGQDKEFSDAAIFKTVAAVQAAGIHVIGNYIFGLPGETEESMQRTLELALALKTEWVNMYPCMLFPGSRLYADAERTGYVLADEWTAYAPLGYECVPYAPDGLTPADVLRFRDAAFLRYIGNPAYLTMIHEQFGLDGVAQILAVLTAGSPKRKLRLA